MVVTDEKGNHANVSLPNEVVEMFVDDLHERNLYVCARISVKPPEMQNGAGDQPFFLALSLDTTVDAPKSSRASTSTPARQHALLVFIQQVILIKLLHWWLHSYLDLVELVPYTKNSFRRNFGIVFASDFDSNYLKEILEISLPVHISQGAQN
ncbi:uncharacterized protein LOC119300112 [Triticum dicoccoides]|uniref:uncharacterized protein LOC119300112 n=1 Tax=Triticum dicoccoides TaxID=85692 RepID=UPI00188EF794|nr:uncharacterized protein LOC119300112 [Triticum dicoccoides]